VNVSHRRFWIPFAFVAGLALAASTPAARAQCWVCIDTSCTDVTSLGICGGASCTVNCRQFCWCRTQGSCGLCSLRGEADQKAPEIVRPIRVPQAAFEGLSQLDPLLAEMLAVHLGEFRPGRFQGSAGMPAGPNERKRELFAYRGQIEEAVAGGHEFRFELTGYDRASGISGTVYPELARLDATAFLADGGIAWEFASPTADEK
jgi:hypothetical protein